MERQEGAGCRATCGVHISYGSTTGVEASVGLDTLVQCLNRARSWCARSSVMGDEVAQKARPVVPSSECRLHLTILHQGEELKNAARWWVLLRLTPVTGVRGSALGTCSDTTSKKPAEGCAHTGLSHSPNQGCSSCYLKPLMRDSENKRTISYRRRFL